MPKVKRVLAPGQRIRVLIVDDSVLIRKLVTRALEADPAIEIVGVAANGNIALAKIEQLNPDAVTLDIEMLEALQKIRRDHKQVRVIMFSTLTELGASSTLEALALGADDYVANVSNQESLDHSLERLRGELIPKIKQFFAIPGGRGPSRVVLPAAVPDRSLRRPAPAIVAPRPAQAQIAPAIVVIGVSTGGPAALARIMAKFPAGFPVPILIVQHMPPLFTKLLAGRLNDTCALRVREAMDGAVIEPGNVWIAPGDFHMRVTARRAQLRIKLDQEPPENSCRPAVDVLFASVASLFESRVLAVVLTGMGRDGQRGCALLKAQGATVLAQDEASSVVWGMPGSVVSEGLADAVLPLDEIPNEIMARISRQTVIHRNPRIANVGGSTKEFPCPR